MKCQQKFIIVPMSPGDKTYRFEGRGPCVAGGAAHNYASSHGRGDSVIKGLADPTPEAEVHDGWLLVALELLDHKVQSGHDIGIRRSGESVVIGEVVEDLNPDDLHVLGNTEVIGANGTGHVSAVAVVVVVVGDNPRDRIRHELGALGGTTAELDMLFVDSSINDVSNHTLAAGGVVELVLVRASGRELGAARDSAQAPGGIVLRLDGDVAVELNRLNGVHLHNC